MAGVILSGGDGNLRVSSSRFRWCSGCDPVVVVVVWRSLPAIIICVHTGSIGVVMRGIMGCGRLGMQFRLVTAGGLFPKHTN